MPRKKKEIIEDKTLATADVVAPVTEVAKEENIKAEIVNPVTATDLPERIKEVKAKVEPKLEVSKVTSVKVVGRNNGVVRVYSLADHGTDFMKLAAEFAVKKKLKLV